VTLSSNKLEGEKHPWEATALLSMYVHKIFSIKAWFRLLMGRSEYKNIITNNYCIHLWDTYSHDYLKTINPNNILFPFSSVFFRPHG
jgi:hypothetical protein